MDIYNRLNPVIGSALKVSDLADYNNCVGLIHNALLDQEILTYDDGRYFLSAKDSNILVHHYRFNDNNGKESQSLKYASRDSLRALVNAEVISVDATFNMLNDKKIKCITVSFKKELRDGSDPQAFLGCIATLPSSESSTSFKVFFLEVLAMVKRLWDIN